MPWARRFDEGGACRGKDAGRQGWAAPLAMERHQALDNGAVALGVLMSRLVVLIVLMLVATPAAAQMMVVRSQGPSQPAYPVGTVLSGSQ